ncbi:DMT family transporter [bacterium]|nr:DMT family transporter [bacterium]
MARKSAAAPRREWVLAALLTVQILFGINYVVSKILVGVFPPLVWASIRSVLSAAVMVGLCLALRRPHPKWSKSYFVPMIFCALTGTIINQAAFLVGLSYTTSTNSAILNTLIPVFTLLIVTLRGQEPATLPRILGFFMALVGVLILRKVEDFNFSNKYMVGDLLTLLNCLSYSIFLSFGKKFLEKHDPLWTTAWLFIYGSIGVSLISIPSWQGFHFPTMTPALWAAGAFAVFGATLLTYLLNFWALAHARSSHVALFIYIQPVITSTIAWAFLNEAITFRTAAASVLIFIAMLLAMSSKFSFFKTPVRGLTSE